MICIRIIREATNQPSETTKITEINKKQVVESLPNYAEVTPFHYPNQNKEIFNLKEKQ